MTTRVSDLKLTGNLELMRVRCVCAGPAVRRLVNVPGGFIFFLFDFFFSSFFFPDRRRRAGLRNLPKTITRLVGTFYSERIIIIVTILLRCFTDLGSRRPGALDVSETQTFHYSLSRPYSTAITKKK